jgi:hypothetical protein
MLFYIVLFIIIIIVVYFLINRTNTKEDFKISKNKRRISKNNYSFNEQINKKINDTLIKTQFDRNYRDIINAFNIIAPSQKSIFNQDDLKEEYIRVDEDELNEIIDNFVNEINRIIIYNVSDKRTNLTGWDSELPERKIQSGWEKQMQSLGLPQSLYNDPVSKSTIKLISIKNPIRTDTEKEIKYSCHLILQKNNIDEQIFIKINFIITKTQQSENKDVIIEEIFVIGFLINENINAKNNEFDKFYNFNALPNSNMEFGTTTQKQQLKMLEELANKYNMRLAASYKFSEDIKKNENKPSIC